MAKLDTEQLWMDSVVLTNSLLFPIMPLNAKVAKQWLDEIYRHVTDVWTDEFGAKPTLAEIDEEVLHVLVHALNIKPYTSYEEKINERVAELARIYPRLHKAIKAGADKLNDPKSLFDQVLDADFATQVKHLGKLIDAANK